MFWLLWPSKEFDPIFNPGDLIVSLILLVLITFRLYISTIPSTQIYEWNKYDSYWGVMTTFVIFYIVLINYIQAYDIVLLKDKIGII